MWLIRTRNMGELEVMANRMRGESVCYWEIWEIYMVV